MSEFLIDSRNNKYSYTTIENSEKIYLFEIIFTFKNNNNLIIRKIKNNIVDKIITLDDEIMYNKVSKIKISVIDINNPKKNAEIKFKLNTNKNSNNITSKKINLEISKITLGYTEINYQLLI